MTTLNKRQAWEAVATIIIISRHCFYQEFTVYLMTLTYIYRNLCPLSNDHWSPKLKMVNYHQPWIRTFLLLSHYPQPSKLPSVKLISCWAQYQKDIEQAFEDFKKLHPYIQAEIYKSTYKYNFCIHYNQSLEK